MNQLERRQKINAISNAKYKNNGFDVRVTCIAKRAMTKEKCFKKDKNNKTTR